LTVSAEELALAVFVALVLAVLLPAAGPVVVELVADDPQPATSASRAQTSSAERHLAIELVRLA